MGAKKTFSHLIIEGETLVRVDKCADPHAVVSAVQQLAGAAVHDVDGDGVKRRAFHRPELRVLDRAAIKTHIFSMRFSDRCVCPEPVLVKQ
jgi:hypothetical protein